MPAFVLTNVGMLHREFYRHAYYEGFETAFFVGTF